MTRQRKPARTHTACEHDATLDGSAINFALAAFDPCMKKMLILAGFVHADACLDARQSA